MGEYGKKRLPRYDPLSERLRNMRHRRGETQVQFARHFNISQHTYRVWEKCGPPKTAAARIGIKWILRKMGKEVNKPKGKRESVSVSQP